MQDLPSVIKFANSDGTTEFHSLIRDVLHAAVRGGGHLVLEPLYNLRQHTEHLDKHNQVVAGPVYGFVDGGGFVRGLGDFPANVITEGLLAGTQIASCAWCGDFYRRHRRGHNYCSPACRDKKRGSRANYAARRRERQGALLEAARVALVAAAGRAGCEGGSDYCELPAARKGEKLTFAVGGDVAPRVVGALTVPAMLENDRAKAAILRLASVNPALLAALRNARVTTRPPRSNRERRSLS